VYVKQCGVLIALLLILKNKPILEVIHSYVHAFHRWAHLNGWVQSLDWTTGLDYWTHPNCKMHLVQCRTWS